MSIIAFASILQWFKTEFLTLKYVLINEGESNRKLVKIFAGKNLEWHKKASRADLIKKRPGAVC